MGFSHNNLLIHLKILILLLVEEQKEQTYLEKYI